MEKCLVRQENDIFLREKIAGYKKKRYFCRNISYMGIDFVESYELLTLFGPNCDDGNGIGSTEIHHLIQ